MEEKATCFLCKQADPECANATSTDRMALRIVYHGHTWKVKETERSSKILPEDSWVASELKRNPERTFAVDELPFEGKCRMEVSLDGVAFVSVPMVVHSWCVSCLFQINPALEHDWIERLLHRMFTCPTLSFGTRKDSVTRGGVACQFCGSNDGWLTFCMYHNNFRAGCDRCRDPYEPSQTYHAFHPSCAVRWGMQRIVRNGQSGMLCARHKDWRARNLKPMKLWMGFLSGINSDLVDPTHLLPSHFAEGLDAPQKGEKYGTSMLPKKK